MLKLSLTTFILGLAVTLFAQTSEVTSAKMAHEDRDFTKAISHIEKAVQHDKTANRAKTWMVKGDIYYDILFDLREEVQALSENAVQISFESYQKALSLDSKLNTDALVSKFNVLGNLSLNKGVLSFNENQFQKARGSFELSIEIAEWLRKTDSLAIFNLGLSCQGLKDYPCAIRSFTQCIEMNYLTESSYESLGYSYMFNGDTESAKKVIEEAVNKYPNNNSLKTSLLNIYLQLGEGENALNLIDGLIDASPTYAKYYSVKGSILANLSRTDEALASLEKGLELDPEDFEMNFNAGSLYFNKASAIMIEASNEEDFEKSDEITKKATAQFQVAKQLLEKAYSVNPSDRGTMDALKNVYMYTNDFDKMMEMKEKLGQ